MLSEDVEKLGITYFLKFDHIRTGLLCWVSPEIYSMSRNGFQYAKFNGDSLINSLNAFSQVATFVWSVTLNTVHHLIWPLSDKGLILVLVESMSSAWIKLEHHDLNSLCYCKCLITYAITYGASNELSKGNTTLFMDLLFIGW